ncbi:MAG: 4-hydroxy-tetrahydrodipicolinate reductase [Deltaproteobacteria bacterium]|nr:4-hydroxy-tetrahydrodipicolinate reductase [Deltaproteobacteria bacterium]
MRHDRHERNAARRIPRVRRANTLRVRAEFLAGITLLLALAERAARALGGEFDVEIVEAHHRYKVDAPSGTALALARAAGEALGLDEDGYVFGREGQVGARETSVIGIHAVRGGDVVGEHELHFLGDGEQVTLRHRATSREAFVRGAVRAAIWIQDKEPGIYSMRDVLGIGRA